MTLRNEDEKGCIYRSEATIEAEDQDLEGSEDGDTESGKTEGSNGEDSDSEAETDANSGEKEEDSTDSDERIKAKRKPVAVSKEDQEKLETKRARMRRRARDEHLVAQKHLPTEPFIYTLRNLWDKPPTQMFPKRPGDKNGVLVHGTVPPPSREVKVSRLPTTMQSTMARFGDQGLIWVLSAILARLPQQRGTPLRALSSLVFPSYLTSIGMQVQNRSYLRLALPSRRDRRYMALPAGR